VLIWRIALALIMLALVALVLIGKARAQVVNAALGSADHAAIARAYGR
jgi:hypothetical protein